MLALQLPWRFGRVLLSCVLLLGCGPLQGAPQPKDLNTPRQFPRAATRAQWEERARQIREQVLISCGLWPLPEKTPLQARLFGRMERDGYAVEKVCFQTLPGFYLAGNLYRPLGQGRGPFPGILNPHGHWKEGRFADGPEGSIAGRCISFARQGMVALSCDMLGYNDTRWSDAPTKGPNYEVHRQFATNRTALLWGISQMGLQTWNSIRALDFLEGLRDVDPKRLACTGESGGGTQTFILGAADSRLAAQAPVVMVSHTMQGGCSCENAPGLRIEYSNVEIAAAAAPRPQMLVAATGDWTKDTLTVEGPAIEHIYRLLDAPDRLRYVRFNFGHNYNQTSREAVYAWFGQWLLHHPASEAVKEPPFKKEADADLRVFPEFKLPQDALTHEQLVESLKQVRRKQWQALAQPGKGGEPRALLQTAWRHTLQVEWPAMSVQTSAGQHETCGEFVRTKLKINRVGEEAAVRATYWAPSGIVSNSNARIVVLCSARPESAPGGEAKPEGLTLDLLQQGLAVLRVNEFSTDGSADPFANFFTTYNRTRLQERVRDLLTVCAAAPSADGRKPLLFRQVVLCGRGSAGLWALLAAPGADTVIADCDQLDAANDEALLSEDLFCPGLRTIGGFEGAALLAAPHPLLLHNTGRSFPTDTLRAGYHAAAAENRVRVEPGRLPDAELVNWICQAR